MRAARLGAGYSPVLDSAATGHDWRGGEPDSPAILPRADSAVSGAVGRKRQFRHVAIDDALSEAQGCDPRSTHIAELAVPLEAQDLGLPRLGRLPRATDHHGRVVAAILPGLGPTCRAFMLESQRINVEAFVLARRRSVHLKCPLL